MTSLRDPKLEASAWFERLGRLPITTAELREFWTWRGDPVNRAAYQVVEKAGLRTRGRFVALPDPRGCSVIDTHTGEPATFANTPVVGVSQEDADDICEILNRRGAQPDASGRLN